MKFMLNKVQLEQKAAIYLAKHPDYFAEGRRPPMPDEIFKPRTVAAAWMKHALDHKIRIAVVAETVVKNVQDLICLVNLTGFTTFVSDSYLEQLGYSTGELVGKNTFDLVHPDDRQIAEQAFAEGLASGYGKTTMRLMRKDGTCVLVEANGKAVRDADGKVIGGVIVSRDITDLVGLTEALQKSKQKFEEIFTHSPIAIEVFSSDGRILEFNPACARLFGVSSREVLGDFNLFMDQNISDEMKGRLKNGESVSYEAEFDFSKVPYASTEKGTKHLRVAINPVKETNGIGYVVQVLDITESVKLTEELRISGKNKDKFMSAMAHDLKSPFNGLLGFLTILKEGGNSPEEISKYVGIVDSSARKIFNLLEALLEWGMLYGGQLDTKIETLNIHNAVTEAIDALMVNSVQKGVAVRNMADERAHVLGMEFMVGRIVANLVSNAIKFTKPGGEITISSSNISSDNGKFVEITVADNGVGIPAAVLPLLFGVADTAVTTTGTAGEKGTGLGLPAVAEMVRRNGGEIRAESEEGKGSRFIFTLPAAQG